MHQKRILNISREINLEQARRAVKWTSLWKLISSVYRPHITSNVKRGISWSIGNVRDWSGGIAGFPHEIVDILRP